MPFYAQINEANIVKAVTQTSGIIESANMIPIESLNESLMGKIYNAGTEEFDEPPVSVILGILTHDKWAIQADDTEVVTLTYTADEAVCFIVNDEIYIVEPVESVATLEITADAVGPIQVGVRGQSLVLAATEVS